MASDNLSQKPEVITLNQLAARLGLSWKTVWRMAKKGEIKAEKIGRSWRVTEEEYARLVGKPTHNIENHHSQGVTP